MNPTEQACDLQRINDYLDEQLPEAEMAEFEEHLGHCDSCQTELQRCAAEPEMWRSAVELLGQTSSATSQQEDQGDDLPDRRKVLSVLDSLAPTDDPEMLGRIGDYEISGVVGVGGMGAVFKGFDKSLRRVVAIKVMAPHLADSGSARARFQREARAAAAIPHDNVIDTYGVSEANGLPYLVMPFARGPSLQKRIDESGPLTAIEVVRIGRQIAAGLAAAHEQGLVHRDIKPANILLNEGIERLWITDFGVARAMDDASMTQTGVIAGTPQYMSPEQARGDTVDHRSDLFSLGSILYTACTGRPPFRSEAAYGILRRITDTDPRPIREVNADVPQWLCRIIERLMAKHPADRFQTAEEVAELFDGCLAHLQQPTSSDLPPSVMLPNHTRDVETGPDEPTLVAAKPRRFSIQRTGAWIMATTILFAVTGLIAMEATSPTDISGQWAGESWQSVSLSSAKEASGWYTGSFTDAQGRRGVIHLEWSRLQRRYNGRWKIGDNQAGSITVRVRDSGGLQGAIALDAASEAAEETPRLREFTWQHSVAQSERANQKPTIDESKSTAKKKTNTKSDFSNSAAKANAKESRNLDPLLGLGALLGAKAANNSIGATFGPASELAQRLRDGRANISAAEARKRADESTLARLQAEIDQLKNQIANQPKSDLGIARRAELRVLMQSKEQGKEVADARLKSRTSELKALQSQLAEATKERDTIIQLLSIQLEAAREKRDASKKLASILDQQFKAGDIGIDALLQARQESQRATSEAEQLEVLLPYFQQLGEASETGNKASSVRPRQNATANAADSIASFVPIGRASPVTEAFGTASDLARRFREGRASLQAAQDELDGFEGRIRASETDIERRQERMEKAKKDDPQAAKLQGEALAARRSTLHRLYNDARAVELSIKNIEAALAEAEVEKQTVLRILEEKRAAAKQRYESEKSLSDFAKKRFDLGTGQVDSVLKANQAAMATATEIRQLELLLEFYANLDGSKKATGDEGAAKTDPKQANTPAALLKQLIAQRDFQQAKLQQAKERLERDVELQKKGYISKGQLKFSEAEVARHEVVLKEIETRIDQHRERHVEN